MSPHQHSRNKWIWEWINRDKKKNIGFDEKEAKSNIWMAHQRNGIMHWKGYGGIYNEARGRICTITTFYKMGIEAPVNESGRMIRIDEMEVW